MPKLYVLAGLLLCSVPVLAQSKKTTQVSKSSGHYTVPITPALPGEEKLSARERVERDLLMPVRRKQAALTLEEAKQASANITAQGVAAAEATAAEEAKKASQTTSNEPLVNSTPEAPTTTKAASSAKPTSTVRKKSSTVSSARKSAAKRKSASSAKRKKSRRR